MESRVLEFDEFRLDCEGVVLSRNGRDLKVQRKPLELLILLVKRRGDVVTRAEIAERLWEPAVFVDTEHGINTAIRKLRQALRDDSAQPRFVQTIPGKGYRFIATTVDVPPVSEITPVAAQTQVELTEPGAPVRSRRWGWVAGIAGGVALTTALAIVYFLVRPTAAQPQITSIAVLPLDNLSPQPGQDYLAAGLTDELITMLAKNSRLRITSRTSVLQYKGAKRPLPQVARELGVDAILEGSISRAGNKVHMTVQLIRAKTDSHIWAESYDRDANDLLVLPQDAARDVAKRLNQAVPPKPLHHVSAAAHDAYMQGRYHWFNGDSDSGTYFQKAVDLQDDYAEAWAGLSDYYMQAAVRGVLSSKDTLAPAEKAAATSLRLDPTLPQAHLSVAAVAFIARWDWPRAERECDRAIEMDPGFSEAYTLRAMLLLALNRPEEAIRSEKKATDLDLFIRPYGMAYILDGARRWDATISEARQRLITKPHDDMLYFYIGDAYAAKGMTKEAEEAVENTLTYSGQPAQALVVHKIFEKGGYRPVLQHFLEWKLSEAKKHYYSAEVIAQAYAELGDREHALVYLEKALAEHSGALLWIQCDWRFDFLHAEDRYRAVVKAVGLPPAY